MIHARALIQIACKILGLTFLIWGINASASIPIGELMRQDEDEAKQVTQDEDEAEQVTQDEDEMEWMLRDEDEDEDEDEITKAIAFYKRITMPILYFVFAFVFFKYAPVIGKKLDYKDRRISIFSHGDWLQVLYNTSILLIGFYMVFKGMPRVINLVIPVFSFLEISLVPAHTWLKVIASVVYLALGFYLLAGGSLVMKVKNIANQNGD